MAKELLPVNVPNPRVGPPALRRRWRQKPQLLTSVAAVTNVEFSLRLPNNRVGPMVLRWKFRPKFYNFPLIPQATAMLPPLAVEANEVAPSLTAGATLPTFPLETESWLVNCQPVAGATLPASCLGTESWIVNCQPITTNTEFGIRLPNNQVGPTVLRRTFKPKYWHYPLIPQATAMMSSLGINANEVAPSLTAGATLPAFPLETGSWLVNCQPAGGASLPTVPLKTESWLVNCQPAAGATLPVTTLKAELWAMCQAQGSVTISVNLSPGYIETQVNCLPLAGAALPVTIQCQTWLVNCQPIAGASLAVNPLQTVVCPVNVQPVGGAALSTFPLETESWLVNCLPLGGALLALSGFRIKPRIVNCVPATLLPDVTYSYGLIGNKLSVSLQRGGSLVAGASVYTKFTVRNASYGDTALIEEPNSPGTYSGHSRFISSPLRSQGVFYLIVISNGKKQKFILS
jgi:hypothetical protein